MRPAARFFEIETAGENCGQSSAAPETNLLAAFLFQEQVVQGTRFSAWIVGQNVSASRRKQKEIAVEKRNGFGIRR